MATDLNKLTKLYGSKLEDAWKYFFDSLNGEERRIVGKMEEILSTRYPVVSESQYRNSNPKTRHAIVALPCT